MNFDTSVLNVPIEDIIPNRFQPRLVFDDASLLDLSNSIKEHGIIQPLVLRRFGDKYEIVAGERRYKAAQLAGLASVPAVISLIDEKTSAEVAIAENVQRKQLTAIEEAKSYKALLDLGYMSINQLASKMGVSAASLDSKLKLLTLSPEVQDAIMENKISERHARSLLVIPEEEEQVQWLHKIIDERLTVRQLDEKLKEIYKGDVNTMNVDFNQVIQNATDIEPIQATSMAPDSFASSPMDLGAPIDLGAKPTNKFFNNLEDSAVSMQMTEAINPLTSGDSGPNLGFGAPQVPSTPVIATIDTTTPAPELAPPTLEEPTVLPSTPAAPTLFDAPSMPAPADATTPATEMFDLSTPSAPTAPTPVMPEVPQMPSMDGLTPVNNDLNQMAPATLETPSLELAPIDSMNPSVTPAPVDASIMTPTAPEMPQMPTDITPSTPEVPQMPTEMTPAVNTSPEEANAKISSLVEELKNMGYNIQMNSMDMPDQLLINIVLKK